MLCQFNKNINNNYKSSDPFANSVLEGHCPAEFCSNFPQHTYIEVYMPSKTLVSWFRSV